MRRHRLAATGGTFDSVHAGHLALVARALAVADRAVVGVAGDALARRRGKEPRLPCARRMADLRAALRARFPGAPVELAELDDDWGPEALGPGLGALVVSEQTRGRGEELNRLRAARGAPPVEVVAVPMELAYDGAPISSTRVRRGEIDASGAKKS